MSSPTQHPLDVQSVGSDQYIVMSRGHHDLEAFMAEAVKHFHGWFLGGPKHVWCKTTPTNEGSAYNFVKEGTRGAWPATYCFEYADDYKRYNGLAEEVAAHA